MIINGCESKEDAIVSNVVNEFENNGIQLKEKEPLSKSFNFTGSKTKQYEFSGGVVYLIYGFEGKDTIKEIILEKLTGHFAETEYPYSVKKLYTDTFQLIFIANSDDPQTASAIDTIFQSIK